MPHTVRSKAGKAGPVPVTPALLNELKHLANAHPELDAVTFRLTPERKKPRIVYTRASDECYGLVPEMCPVVKGIVEEIFPSDLIDEHPWLAQKCEDLLDRLHDRVTSVFRRAYQNSLVDKYAAIDRLLQQRVAIDDMLASLQTDRKDVDPSEMRPDVSETRVYLEDDEEDC